MPNVIQFPKQVMPANEPFNKAMTAIENRLGVSFQDYLGKRKP